MEPILANFSASISELKENPSGLIQKAEGCPITILNHDRPMAYLIPAETYETLSEMIEDHELGHIILDRKSERQTAIEVSIDEL